MAGTAVQIKARIGKTVQALRKARLDAVLVSSPVSIRWLAGIGDLRWILVTRKGVEAMPARLAVQAARSSLSGAIRVLAPSPGWKSLLGGMRPVVNGRMGYEDRNMIVSVHARLIDALDGRILAVPVGDLFESLRAVKAQDERKAILEASRITGKVASWLPQIICPGITEHELAGRVDSLMRLLGADAPAFDTIALSGPKTAMPHGVSDGKVIRKGELVLIDFGARVRGYHSDCTRTYAVGSSSEKQRHYYGIVYRAYEAARSRIHPGGRAEAPYTAAQRALGKLGKYFIHGLGHGVGLEIHETPSLSSGSRDFLARGEFVTVEPGIYIPGWGGIRLEDTVLITGNGAMPVTGELSKSLPLAGIGAKKGVGR